MAKKNFYTVWVGKKPGVYTKWADCLKQVDGVNGAVYKAFPSYEMALEAFNSDYHKYIGKPAPKKELSKEELSLIGKPVFPSIAVDAACNSRTGRMEYQGVDAKTGKLLFHQGPFDEGTNNIGEFLAIVHGLAFLQKHNSSIPLYTDSVTAMKWVRIKRANTEQERTEANKQLFELVDRAEHWLKNNQWPNQILKWHTEAWGEIPADFGRK